MNKEKDTAKSAKPVSLRENVEKTVSRSTADKEAIDISRTFEGTERNESDVTKCPLADDKESLRRCKKSRSTEKVPSQTIGFPAKLPPKFLTEITIKASFEVPEARSGLVVSQAMLVLHVKEHSVFSDKVAVCDFICSINDHEITSKAEFCELIRALKRSAKPFTMKVKRPIWNMKTDHLPKGYDVVPGYDYFLGLMVLYPGGKLGMNVKSYNSKVASIYRLRWGKQLIKIVYVKLLTSVERVNCANHCTHQIETHKKISGLKPALH
uniref:PDZ domain-containing protein n=2 Tax=Parascaris univalens TaxID=6257 RepID=A0A915C214_PARUN